MPLNNENNNECCKCTTPEIYIELNQQGPQGRQGAPGLDGFSPDISIAENTENSFKLRIEDKDGVITTPNLKVKANLPAGGATGQVLTKNSANQDDCSWQNLPNATTEVEGIARLATETDFEVTGDSAVSDTSIVTPALFNTEFKKQSANFVTTDTFQTITQNKLIKSSLILNEFPSNGELGEIITNGGVTGNNPIIKITGDDLNKYLEIGHPSDNNPAGFKIPFNGNYVELYQGRDNSKIVQLDALKNLYLQAGDNIVFEDYPLTGGIKISATGGGQVPEDVALKSANQTFTGRNYFNGQVNFNSTVQFTNQQVNIPKLYSSNKITGVNISLDSQGQSFQFPCEKGTIHLSATSGDYAGTTAGLYIYGAGIDKKRLLTEGDAYTLPQANATALGGVKANPKTDEDTQAVNIDPATGLLYTKAGGSNSLNAINMVQNNFNNYIKAGVYYWSSYTPPLNHPNGNYKGMLQVLVREDGNSPVVQIFTLGEALDTSTPPEMWIRYCISGRSPGYKWSNWLKVNGGEIPDNMVTTNTAQTITGTKTFDGSIAFLNDVNLTSQASTFTINLGDGLSPAQYCNITIRDGGLNIIDYYNTGNELNFITKGTYWRVSGDLRRYINGTDYSYITTADIGNLKYWTGTEAAYTELTSKDADTLYRTTDTNKVFLGTIQIGGNT